MTTVFSLDQMAILFYSHCSSCRSYPLVLLYLFESISSVQSLSHVELFVTTPWTVAHQASLSITNSWSLLKLMSIESVMPSNHLILCCPLLLLPSIFPSIRVFSSETALHIRWLKYWSFRFGISPSSEYSGLISFRINWFDLLAVQGTLKSLFQHHNWKALILGFSAFFVFQLRCSFAHHQQFHQHGRYSLSLLCWQSMCSLSAQGLFPRLPSLPGSST